MNTQKKTQTLLERAKSIPTKKGRARWDNDEIMEVALAWAKEEINGEQVSFAIGCNKGYKNGNYLYAMGVGLRRAIRLGRLIEKP